MKIKKWKKLFTMCLLMGLGSSPFSAWADPFEQLGVARPRTSKQAPDFVLHDLHGKKVSLNQFKGKPILINFWATWCGPCKEELPSIQRLHDASKSNGDIQIVAISIDRSNIEKVNQYARDLNLTFPILLDPDRIARKPYFVRSLPTSYLIDADGKLQGFISGARQWDSPAATQVFRLLAHPGK
jgi:cytochrome c biogenesis protein CcmG/thiol:disulfide interchange protein DsbE